MAHAFGAEGFRNRSLGGPRQKLLHQIRLPGAGDQFLLGLHRSGRTFDERNHLVHVGDRHSKAFQNMPPVTRFAQLEHGAACHHLTAMINEGRNHLLQVQRARLTVDQGHHIHAEGVLQLGVFVKVVQHHLGHFTTLQFNHHPHAGFVGFITNVRDAFDAFLIDVFGNALKKVALIHLIREFVNDDGLTGALIDVFEMGFRPHDHAAAARAIALANARKTINDSGRWEVGCGDEFNEFIHRGFRVFQNHQAASHHFGKVVGRNVGGHAHGNARRAVN